MRREETSVRIVVSRRERHYDQTAPFNWPSHERNESYEYNATGDGEGRGLEVQARICVWNQ